MFDISWPWALILIAILLIVAGIGGTFAYEASKRKHGPSPDLNSEVLRRLDQIDKRLQNVEKTLNDIP